MVCLSVNDAYVMNAWSDTFEKGHSIEMLCDWNCALSDALQLSDNLFKGGLGRRALRFSAVVDNGVVKSVNIEKSPGDLDVTSTSVLLTQL